ncbi:MAG: TrkA family potassium uptake protein [Propionibacteriaceae bacterium]|jgi:trk system potassium uptake protein TrkA|nr:TrkA family potassium uptake protein [Propionibacteriaceae bacterium]
MRISIAGAGKAGRAIANQLLSHDHSVLLIDRDPRRITPAAVPRAEWLMADACEIDSLEEADLSSCDVAVAATGDDKANLVHSFLAKTEFAVPRVVARVNHPNNEWLFNPSWGVDVAVSAPSLMSAVIDEAVAGDELVHLFSFENRQTALVSFRLPETSPWAGHLVSELTLPDGATLVTVVREGQPLPPTAVDQLLAADELILLAARHAEAALRDRFSRVDD